MTVGTLRWVGVPEGEVCGPGVSGESKVNVGLTQGSAWSPLLFIAMVKLISRKICTKDILRKLLYSDAWPGSSSDRGSKSPRTADRVERYVQQTWTESMFGEDGWDIGGKSCKYLGGAICGVGSSPISKRKNLSGVAWTLA